MTQDEAIKIFNRQTGDNPNKPIFGVYKELFELTYDFDISDWKRIRTEKYWSIVNNLDTEEKKKRHTLKSVWYYIRNIRYNGESKD